MVSKAEQLRLAAQRRRDAAQELERTLWDRAQVRITPRERSSSVTFAELIAKVEQQKRDAERRRSDAQEKLKRLRDRVLAEGRKHFSEQEEARADEWIAVVRAAGDEVKALEGQLAGIRAVQAEDAEVDRQLTQPHPTGVRPPGYDREVQPGREASDGRSGARDGAPRWVRAHDRRPAAVAGGQRFAEHEIVSEYAAHRQAADQAVIGQHGSLGQLVRAMTTSSGSAVVPTIWASSIIDRARNLAAVLRAGAAVVPMDAKTVQIGRLTGDPTAGFRAEGSPITASDPVFDNVTLDSKTMSALVVGSLEWFQDAPNADLVVEEAIAQAVALELDRIALFGGITTGGEGINLPTPPNPRGILATLLAVAASSVLGSGANGTAQTAASYWREVQSTVFAPQTFNETPNAILWNAKLLQQYVDAYDTTNQPLAMPANIAELARFTTNQIPSFTQGTMTSRATDLFVGDFAQLLIGQRLEFTVQTLTERYAENGQIGIVAHWRGDIQLARPRAFAVYRYLQGAA